VARFQIAGWGDMLHNGETARVDNSGGPSQALQVARYAVCGNVVRVGAGKKYVHLSAVVQSSAAVHFATRSAGSHIRVIVRQVLTA